MEMITKIYQAVIIEYQNGAQLKQWAGIFYTKPEAVRFCMKTLKRRYCVIKGAQTVTERELLDFMDDKGHSFQIVVTEYSGNRRIYRDAGAYGNALRGILNEAKEKLYDNLLSIMGYTSERFDCRGNSMGLYASANRLEGHGEDAFFGEECMDGSQGSEPLHNAFNGKCSYRVQKIYYYFFTEIYRETAGNGQDKGYSGYCCSAETLEEAVEHARYSMFHGLERYFSSREEYMELTEEQERELFKEKVSSYTIKIFVVSGKRFRFDTVGELGLFYAEKIKTVTREELYGFLLSLVQYEERHYDVDGHFMGSKIKRQEICGEEDYNVIPQFSMETMDDVWEELEKNMESTENKKGCKNNSPSGNSAKEIM